MNDIDYLRKAIDTAASASDDPRTRNGAVLVSADGDWVVHAANVIPLGVKRKKVRVQAPAKYEFIEHAERAAIYNAAYFGIRTGGARLYVPWFACPDCARAIVMAGIEEVVGSAVLRELTPERWLTKITLGEKILDEAGVGMRWLAESIDSEIRFDGHTVRL